MGKRIVRISLIALTIGPLLMTTGKLFASTIDVSTGVPATAAVGLLTAMSVGVRHRTTHAAATSVAWGTLPAGTTYSLAHHYIVLSATSNRVTWKIDVYTNNVPRVSTSAAHGVYQAAGLYNTDAPHGTTNFIRVPVLWIISGATITVTYVGPPPAAGAPLTEANSNLVHGSTASARMGWMYVKDKADQEDPTIPGDQSWGHARAGGYTVCLYGGPAYRNLPIGLTTGNPNYVYIEGDFTPAAGGKSYETTIWFDLYH